MFVDDNVQCCVLAELKWVGTQFNKLKFVKAVSNKNDIRINSSNFSKIVCSKQQREKEQHSKIVIYYIICEECHVAYYRKTGRNLSIRAIEHIK